jgi:hypothetical protein
MFQEHKEKVCSLVSIAIGDTFSGGTLKATVVYRAALPSSLTIKRISQLSSSKDAISQT